MSLIEFTFIENHENIEIKIPGLIKAFVGDSIPEGYLACNGAEVLISSYPDLYNAIGNSFCPPPYRESGDASVAVNSGGNTGDGTLTMNDSPLDNFTPPGIYTVRCIDAGDVDATPKPNNAGDGTLTMDEDSPYDFDALSGEYHVFCTENITKFAVISPNTQLLGIATVGTPFNNKVRFTITAGSTPFVQSDGFYIEIDNTTEFELRDPDSNLLATINVDENYWGLLRFKIENNTSFFAIGDGWDITVTEGSIITPTCTEGYFKLPTCGISSKVTSLNPFIETIVIRKIIKT